MPRLLVLADLVAYLGRRLYGRHGSLDVVRELCHHLLLGVVRLLLGLTRLAKLLSHQVESLREASEDVCLVHGKR